MALDLTGVKDFVERDVLVDTVVISRDNGSYDDVLDEDTGLVVPTTPTVVVTEPRAAVQALTPELLEDPDVARVVDETKATHRLLLPLSSAYVANAGDLVRVTVSGALTPDPQLLQERFEVASRAGTSTHTVLRTLYLRRTATNAV